MKREPRDIEAEALAACDREEIHTPGRSQSFGAILAFDRGEGRVCFASANMHEYLGVDLERVLGQKIEELLPRSCLHRLANLTLDPLYAEQRCLLGHEVLNGVERTVFAHGRGERCVLEIDEAVEAPERMQDVMGQMQWLIGHTQSHDVQTLLDSACRLLRSMTGFDRVKAYELLPDGAGQVVAETRAAHVDSYLGLRFPSYDIPPRARALFLSTPIRVIADVEADDVVIRASSRDAGELDLSAALLRGTAPVHLQYLRNVNVRSSMTLPILCEDTLWGLFAAHSATRCRPGPTTTMALQVLGRFLSAQVEHKLQAQRELTTRATRHVARKLIVVDDSELSFERYWEQGQDALRQSLPNSGVAFCVNERVYVAGSCPSEAACRAIRVLAPAGTRELRSFDALSELDIDAELASTAGALVIPLVDEPATTSIFFRDEISKTITWAGAPEKTIEESGAGVRLLPRGSFKLYEESVRGHSDSWTKDDLEYARSMQLALTELLEMRQALRDNRHRLGLVVRELEHRTSNLFALVSSLVSSAATGASSIAEFRDAVQSRVEALHRAHRQLSEGGDADASMRALVERELRPFLAADEIEASVVGPELCVLPEAMTVLVLIVHELVSNAVKHGALSTDGGSVRTHWSVEGGEFLLAWTERDGPQVCAPSRRGFGHTILRDAARFELDGSAELDFASEGFEARFRIPAR